mmetsp:Transcript_19477/g.23324  ORF Transcript_19477/g.23324 Transcript_19477/m.23324 type:complete len:382 (+) Transcript_19477:258-1403(+)|eukprot:CAMPEP_0197863520 /NCGR_PEP_ID=MMETSP1438-20131217/41025_1 /TAXON_ID=1461541 /ORGANISM="Pterosperma sp., Strain CCMP1384" /LENGTH=381 /DNA_ID=CAMNT_0043481447 /DNA_START=238 /DNA_END=1383 /DNA_ORIENTATION=-
MATEKKEVHNTETPVEQESLAAPVAHAALAAVAVAPLLVQVPTNANIVVTACLAVYVGSYRSYKPEQPMQETLTQKDAMKFPLVGSCVLFGLFLLFKFLPKDLVNMVLTAYFVLLGVIALTASLLPFVSKLFTAEQQEKVYRFGTLKIPFLVPEPLELQCSPPELVGGVCSMVFCIWYCINKHFFANNTLGLAFSIQGIEFLSVGSIKIGAILLCGLFLYDIFWVFCTPVMVTVAKSFDAPIKLLFPRVLEAAEEARPFSMLGLGDIVVPGIFVAIMLRYDVISGNASKPYFHSAFAGYAIGLITTIAVMNIFNAAQPALLYIVPGVLISVAICAAVRGDSADLLAYEESSALGDLLNEGGEDEAVSKEGEKPATSSSKKD